MQDSLNFETPIKYAPEVKLQNGNFCVPQHYLQYNHTLESVENIVADIEFDVFFPIFVCKNNEGVYLQVGIIGFDNYKSITSQNNKKIVYGRKWRVEVELPTSEIIQTVYIAIKTAREHEARELFRLSFNNKQITPFNNHHDLPLMTKNSELFTLQRNELTQLNTPAEINQVLQNISYNDALIHSNKITKHGENWLVDFQMVIGELTWLQELAEHKFTLIFTSVHSNSLYYQLMNYFISLSEKYVQDNFTYRGFNRFSENNSIEAIGELSAHTRDKTHYGDTVDFSRQLEIVNNYTDITRVPNLTNGVNSQKIRERLAPLGQLSGQPPII